MGGYVQACAQWAWGSWHRLEPIVGIPAGLLPPPLSWIPIVILFVFLLPFAPYKLWQKQRVRIDELEEERIPKVTVTPEGDRRHWEHQSTEHLMWAELTIRNTSPIKTLYNVEVRVTKYTTTQEKLDKSGEYLLMEGLADFKASQVYWSRRDADPPHLAIDIPPNSARTSLIAFSNNSNGPPAILNAPIKQILSLGGKLEVEVTSPDSAAWKGEFYIECHQHYVSSLQQALDKGGIPPTFEFIPWEQWLETHPIASERVLDRVDSQNL